MTWTATRLKNIARVGYGLGQPPTLSDNGIPILRATNILRGKISPKGLIFAAKEDLPLDRAPLLREGEILVVRSGAYTGDSALVTSKWAGSAPGYDLRVSPIDADPRYLAYCMLSTPALDQFYLAKSRAAQPHLNAEDLGSILIKTPELDEQRRIADFLDAETARIDQLMANQYRLLELLEERANSRILNLIGQSTIVRADGTSVIPLRRVVEKIDRPVRPTNEVITAFRDGQVTSRSRRRSEGYTMAASSEPQGQGVDIGDIVIHGLDGFAGAIGDSEASGNCTPVYHVCKPIDGGNASFYGRLLRLLAVGDYLALFGASARERAVDFRNWKIFGHAPVPLVLSDEQHEIGALITKVRPLREKVRHFNEVLAERRQALITAAVTGEIDVTTARRPSSSLFPCYGDFAQGFQDAARRELLYPQAAFLGVGNYVHEVRTGGLGGFGDLEGELLSLVGAGIFPELSVRYEVIPADIQGPGLLRPEGVSAAWLDDQPGVHVRRKAGDSSVDPLHEGDGAAIVNIGEGGSRVAECRQRSWTGLSNGLRGQALGGRRRSGGGTGGGQCAGRQHYEVGNSLPHFFPSISMLRR